MVSILQTQWCKLRLRMLIHVRPVWLEKSRYKDFVAADWLRLEEFVATRWSHRFSLVSCWYWLSGERFRKGSSSSPPFSFRTLLLKSRQHWGHEGRKAAVFSLKSGLSLGQTEAHTGKYNINYVLYRSLYTEDLKQPCLCYDVSILSFKQHL